MTTHNESECRNKRRDQNKRTTQNHPSTLFSTRWEILRHRLGVINGSWVEGGALFCVPRYWSSFTKSGRGHGERSVRRVKSTETSLLRQKKPGPQTSEHKGRNGIAQQYGSGSENMGCSGDYLEGWESEDDIVSIGVSGFILSTDTPAPNLPHTPPSPTHLRLHERCAVIYSMWVVHK